MGRKKTRLVLLVGANGRVGDEMRRRWPEEYLLAKPREMLDVTNLQAVHAAIRELRPDVVVNAAAISDPIAAEADPRRCWQVNAVAPMQLAKLCALSGTALIHLSCSDVFGDTTKSRPLLEMDTLGYGGVLAASKQVGESGVLTVSQCPVSVEVRRGFRWWILRSSMLYARYHPRSAHWLAMLLRTRDGYTPVSIPADVRRSPTYIPHLVREVVWLIANYDDVPDGIYHVGNVGDASMVDVASRLLLETRMQLKWEAVGRDDSARLARIPAAAFPRYGCLDHTFWSRVTRRQLPTWEEGLVEFVRVLRGS